MNFSHMSADEIASHIEKFGTDEQKTIVNKLYDAYPEVDYSDCPYCDDHQVTVQNALETLTTALEALAECNYDEVKEQIENAELSLSL